MSQRSAETEISVVIPARDVAYCIGGQLAALATQRTSAAWEVVVADNGSSDGTAETVVATPFPVPLKVTDASRSPGINVARNVGVEKSTGSHVLLCDADDEVLDSAVAHLFLDPTELVVAEHEMPAVVEDAPVARVDHDEAARAEVPAEAEPHAVGAVDLGVGDGMDLRPLLTATLDAVLGSVRTWHSTVTQLLGDDGPTPDDLL